MASLTAPGTGHKPLRTSVQTIIRHGAEYHIRWKSGNMVKDGQGGFDRDPNTPVTCIVDVRDIVTQQLYDFKGEGPDEDAALADAAAKLIKAPKPKSAAQLAEEKMMSPAELIAAKERELAELRARANLPAKEPAPSTSSRGRITTSLPG